MEYRDIDEVIKADGLRLVMVQGLPSPWGQAAKAMLEYKGLKFLVGPQVPGAENPELQAWSHQNSGPVLAWNDERPLSSWTDILFLIERLEPDHSLVPSDPADRVWMFGLAHEICGEKGFGWNRRLDIFHHMVQAGGSADGVPSKYGYSQTEGERAKGRVDRFLDFMTNHLEDQKGRGSAYLVGNSLSAADFYWAAFSNLLCLQPDALCPLHPDVRAMFEGAAQAYVGFNDSILIEHRDRMMQEHFKLPMEL